MSKPAPECVSKESAMYQQRNSNGSGSEAPSLPGILHGHPVPELVQNAALVSAPERCDEKIFRTVSRETVNDDLRREDLEAADHQIQVFFPGKNGEWLAAVFLRQIRAGKNVQELQLDTLNITPSQIFHSLEHPRTGLSREAENRVNDDLDSCAAQIPDRLIKDRKSIAAADAPGSILMDGLKAKFHPHTFLPVQAFQKIDDFRRKDVRAGGDGKSANFGIRYSALKLLPNTVMIRVPASIPISAEALLGLA